MIKRLTYETQPPSVYSLLKATCLTASLSVLVACGGSGSGGGESGDTTAPTLTLSPASGATIGSASNKRPSITATFSEAVTKVNATNVVFKQGGTPKAITITGSGTTYTIAPNADLAASTNYTLTFKNKIADAAGNKLVEVNANYTSSDFVAPDTTAPTFTANPSSGSIIGSPNNKRPAITVTFSEPVNHVNADNVAFKSASGPMSITVNGSGSSYTIALGADLVADTEYTLEFNAEVKDAADNPLSTSSRTARFTAYKQKISFNAWVGATNTLLDVNDSLPNGSELYSYRAARYGDCDISNITACTNGQNLLLNGQTITNIAHTLADPAHYKLKEGSALSTNSNENTTRFSFRHKHQTVFFKDKFWVIGGDDGVRKNDVWSSPDGIQWTQVKAHKDNPTASDNQFSPRVNHQVVVYDDKLWLIGGRDNVGRKNDTWTSSDGINWTKKPFSGPIFSARDSHQVVVFKNKIWVIGGVVGTSTLSVSNEVWYSTDGVDWRSSTPTISGTFPRRFNFQAVVTNFNGTEKLWLIGGSSTLSGAGQYRNDVLSSTDGSAWASVMTDQASLRTNQFSQRYNHQVVVFNNKLWLIGGLASGTNNRLNDVWSSTDGSSWSKSPSSGLGERFTGRDSHQVQVAEINGTKQLYVIGGYAKYSNTKINKNDVWRSQNGSDWRLGYWGEITRP